MQREPFLRGAALPRLPHLFTKDATMPLVRLCVPAHLEAGQVRGLADAVHEALVDCCKVPRGDHFQLISRFAPGDMILDPTFGGVQRSSDACVIEITLLAGRSDSQKRRFYSELVARAVRLGFSADDVMVGLVENGAMDWSLGRGEVYADK